MQAVCWYGKNDIRVEAVADPTILNPTDVLLRVTRTAICGSDLHLLDGFIPAMAAGDILGHEFTGEVIETGAEVKKLQRGDRVVVPFAIACGQCYYCRREQWSLCDNSNPRPEPTAIAYGDSPAGLFGYSHLMGGYAGGQAQYVRVPYADVGPLKLPEDVSDEQALFLSDVFPTGYMAAENCDLRPGDTVAVWGCGPVGQFAIRSAYLLGADKVIAIDAVAERLHMAAAGGAEPLHYDQVDDLQAELKWRTGGRGPDACIDAVGLEAQGRTVGAVYDRIKTKLWLETDRGNVLRQAMLACRKGGTISIPGVYGGLLDSLPVGAAFAKGLTLHLGQTHVQRYLQPLLERIRRGDIDPTFLITHRLPLAQAPAAYRMFRDRKNGCVKVVLDPWGAAQAA
ncbi:MAG TPA: zinc-dependent alcohol dehydrogenase [Terriglobales bacterium]|nr:zinc-dependent alcohol dehydrogenase [Terriglobales bacterium]